MTVPAPIRDKVKVLIVDDSPYNLLVLKIIIGEITEKEIEVHSAFNGKQAIAKVLAEILRPFDLILLDLQMPIMDGYQVSIFQFVNQQN